MPSLLALCEIRLSSCEKSDCKNNARQRNRDKRTTFVRGIGIKTRFVQGIEIKEQNFCKE